MILPTKLFTELKRQSMALPIANQEVLLVLLILEMSVAVEKAENYIDVMILNKSILVILKEIGNDYHCVMMIIIVVVMMFVMLFMVMLLMMMMMMMMIVMVVMVMMIEMMTIMFFIMLIMKVILKIHVSI